MFPNPFNDTDPHPLAIDAARVLQAELSTGFIAPGVPTTLLHRAEGGKMFGVLVVQDASGELSSLRAFSGQIDRAWTLPGYAPPLFEPIARAAFEPVAEKVVKGLTARVDAARLEPALLALREELTSLTARIAGQRAQLRQRLASNKQTRKEARERTTDTAELHAIDQLSRRDDAERRAFEKSVLAAHEALQHRLHPAERRLAALERLRRIVSQETMRRLWDTYLLTSFSGEQTPLRSLFIADPPSGASDCAGPRLLDAARRANLIPVAMAEFWWGAPPPGGGRVEGMFFPACKEKCGVVLPFLLRGLEVEEKQIYRPREVREDELEILFEDEHLLLVNKPSGLLSVPARDERLTDSVLARVKRKHPQAMAVHRLDLDTSGVLLLAKNLGTYQALQAQFIGRRVEKRYEAVLEGTLVQDEGTISLPLRVDLDQRPRQLVDFEHGKSATTRWKVLERINGTTRVSLFPITGRSHQLRVHAAHASGLNLPIVGDRLYGTPGQRLLLHAATLRFKHPHNDEWMTVEAPTPF